MVLSCVISHAYSYLFCSFGVVSVLIVLSTLCIHTLWLGKYKLHMANMTYVFPRVRNFIAFVYTNPLLTVCLSSYR